MMSRVRGGDQSEKTAGKELDMLSWMGRTTLEVLGQAGLGYSFDPLTEDVADEFASAVKSFLCVPSHSPSRNGNSLHMHDSPQLVKSVIPRIFLPIAVKLGPASFRRRVVDMLPSPNIQRMKDISDILHARSVQIFNEKKAALARGDDAIKHQIGEGRDIMSILCESCSRDRAYRTGTVY